MDPLTLISTIGMGLKLVDQFRDLAIRFMGNKLEPPSATAEQKTKAIQIKHEGKIVQEVKSSELQMDKWDDVRYKALERRVKANWELFHELFSQLPELSTDEKARINLRLERIKGELCEDFREMVRLYEQTLGTRLPDHYSLYEVCGSAS